jgi:hypothetical protein
MRGRSIATALALLLAIAGCDSSGEQPATTGAATSAPAGGTTTPTDGPAGGACGDGRCEGPETADNCPQDCAETATTAPPGGCGDGVCDGPENDQTCPEDCGSGESQTADDADACALPNPHHAVVSTDLEIWHDFLSDGGFEEGTAEVVLSSHSQPDLRAGRGERSAAAARTGSFGYEIVTGAGEGTTFSIRAYTEKGDEVQYSFWARSPGGAIDLQPVITGGNRNNLTRPEVHPESAPGFTVGSDWSEIVFSIYNLSDEYQLLTFEVGPDTTLHIDDVRIEQHIWRTADYSEPTVMVGGIPVPPEPVAPVHLNVLIHIEDPDKLNTIESYFWQQTTIMEELAALLHRHGGHLTIQPEEDWAMASEIWGVPTLPRDLVEDYGVVYSTHTHGPHCRDTEGRLRSNSDCRANEDTDGWDHDVTSYDNPWVTEYVGSLRELLSAASGTEVTDHNGNWEFPEASTFAGIGIETWSAYKEWRTQATYDVLINNPWRPSEVSPDGDIAAFLTHDAETSVIYVPGWGQNVARYLDRLAVKMPPLISQFIRYATADRVNSAYVVTHVGSFYPLDGDEDAYISYDETTGELTYSEEFREHLRNWDQMLVDLVDPLVAAGYLQWTSLPEIGDLYVEWEEGC